MKPSTEAARALKTLVMVFACSLEDPMRRPLVKVGVGEVVAYGRLQRRSCCRDQSAIASRAAPAGRTTAP
jgi:hypothetical protein